MNRHLHHPVSAHMEIRFTTTSTVRGPLVRVQIAELADVTGLDLEARDPYQLVGRDAAVGLMARAGATELELRRVGLAFDTEAVRAHQAMDEERALPPVTHDAEVVEGDEPEPAQEPARTPRGRKKGAGAPDAAVAQEEVQAVIDAQNEALGKSLDKHPHPADRPPVAGPQTVARPPAPVVPMAARPTRPADPADKGLSPEQLREKRRIQDTLDAHFGNALRAAKARRHLTSDAGATIVAFRAAPPVLFVDAQVADGRLERGDEDDEGASLTFFRTTQGHDVQPVTATGKRTAVICLPCNPLFRQCFVLFLRLNRCCFVF